MLRLPKKLLFAIEAVLDIAYNAGGQPVQSKEITARQEIPRRYLEQVLQQLVRAGILSGVRGPRGGYLLARERRRISIGDIARVVSTLETEEQAAPTSPLGAKVVWPIWQGLHAEVMEKLDAITLEDLCMKASQAGVESRTAERLDFVI